MRLTKEQTLAFGKELVGCFGEEYIDRVELTEDGGFCAKIDEENTEISMECFTNGEIHYIFYTFMGEGINYKIDVDEDSRFNNYYNLLESAYEINQECNEGLDKRIEYVEHLKGNK